MAITWLQRDTERSSSDHHSMGLLSEVAGRFFREGWVVSHLDVTVVAERVRIAPHRVEMRGRLSELLKVGIAAVSVKATTTDGLGFVGRDEGLAAVAVVTASRSA